ncbi:PKD domain-containing protein, partial [Vibrio vulnificus]|nr:PKD domain-containing protein [Vibrio vulnificus]
PKALFDVTYDSNNPFKVVFANQSTDADGDELTYSWDFGDGSQSEDKAPTHTYPTLDVDKVYVVKLTVSDGKLTDVYSTSLTIRAKAPEVPENTAPVAKFTSQVAG